MFNNNVMIMRFVIYGFIGWGAEVLWTGLHSLLKKDFRLTSQTSIWMFFIYGSAVFFEPLVRAVERFPLLVRGLMYVLCIFTIEYIVGIVMKKLKVCPWDYSAAKLNVHGVIRLDYAPAWLVMGLLFEFVFLRLV